VEVFTQHFIDEDAHLGDMTLPDALAWLASAPYGLGLSLDQSIYFLN
jgi:hypothetical protein